MADNTVGIKFTINGGEEVIKGVNQVGNALNMLNERLKSNRTGFDNWGATATKMEQYEENLRSKLQLLGKGIEAGTSQLKRFHDAEGNITRDGSKLQATLEKWKRAEQETTQELNALTSGLFRQKETIAQTEKNIEDLESKIKVYTSELDRNKYSVNALNKENDALLKKYANEKALESQLYTALERASQIYDKNSNELNEYRQAHNRASEAVAETKNQIENLQKRINNLDYTKAADGLNQLGNFASSVGQAFQLVSAGAATALKSAVSTTIDYESAFAGVKKTADDVEVAYYGLQEVFDDTKTSFEEFRKEYENGTKRAQEAEAAGYSKIKQDLEALATQTASTVEQIMQVAEYAGQLGIPADQIAAFTEVVVKMGDSTSYETEEAALSLARLGNVLMDSGLSADEAAAWYNKLGAVIVDLGNNAAALEPEIGNVLQRIAAVGKQSKFTTAELAALSTALVSTGIKEEAGGTALMNTISQIEKAVAGAGDKLRNFAKVSGMSAQEFSIAWKTTPMIAMQEFLKGLQKMNNGAIKSSSEIDREVEKSSKKITKNLENVAKIAGMTGEEFKAAWTKDPVDAMQKYQEGLENVNLAGENAITMLSKLGINSKRQTQAVLSLAASEEQLEEYLKRANEEWEKAEALNTEAKKRYETLATSISQMREAWEILGSVMGESVTPIIQALTEAMRDLASYLVELPKPVLAIATGFLGVTAAIAPLAYQIASMTMAFSGLLQIANSDTVFADFAKKLVKPFKNIGGDIAQAGVDAENAVKTGFVGKIKTALQSATSGIGKALEWAFAPFKDIGKFFGELFKGIETTLAPLTAKVGNLVMSITTPFVELAKFVGEQFGVLFSGIASKITPLLSALGGIAGKVAPIIAVAGAITLVVGALTQLGGGTDEVKTKIDNFATSFTEKFATFAQEFPTMLSNAFGTISQNAPQIIETVVNALSDGLPKLMQSGAEILTTIATAIADNLPSLIDSAVSIIGTLVEALIENLPEILGAAAKIIASLVEGIVKALPDILEAGGKIIGKLVEALTEGLVSLGKAGLELAKKVISAIEEGWKNAKKIGENFIAGIVKGIREKWDALKEKVQGVVDSIKGLFTGVKGFDEHSPSKWAEQVAEYVDEGLAIGFENGEQEVIDAAENIVKSVQDVIKDLPTKYFNVGKKTAKNLAKGINNGMKNVVNSVKDIAYATADSLEVINGDFATSGKEAAQSFKNGMNALQKATINDFTNTVKGVINSVATKKNKSELNKAGTELIKAFKDSIKKETTSLVDETSKAIDEIVSKADEAYKNVVKDQENLYNKMSNLSSLFEDDRLPTLTALERETAIVEQYGENLLQLKDKIPDSLMQEILSKDVEAGLNYTNGLLSMSEERLTRYVEAINNLESASRIASGNFYEQDLADIEAQFNSDLETAMSQLESDAEQYGANVVQGLINGMKSNQAALSGAARSLANTVSTTLASSLKINSPSKVAYKDGKYFVDGFINAFDNYGNITVKKSTEKLANNIGNTLVNELRIVDNKIVGQINNSLTGINKTASSKIMTTIDNLADVTRTYSDVISDGLFDNLTNSINSAIGAGIDSMSNMITTSLTGLFNNLLVNLIPSTGNIFLDALIKILANIGGTFIGSFVGGIANDIKNGISNAISREADTIKTDIDNFKFAVRDKFSKYNSKEAYADSYYFGETVMAGITDGVEDNKKKAYNSVLNGALNSIGALSEANNIAANTALQNNAKIINTAHNTVNAIIDYDRLKEIIGDRAIYLGERQVGRELRNMGVQFV